MTTAGITSDPITIEHVRITCKRSFDKVRAALATELPELDARIIPLLTGGDQAAIADHEKSGPKLFIFLKRDQITVSKMTRHQLDVALYAPLRVAPFETESGEAVFEYDPSLVSLRPVR